MAKETYSYGKRDLSYVASPYNFTTRRHKLSTYENIHVCNTERKQILRVHVDHAYGSYGKRDLFICVIQKGNRCYECKSTMFTVLFCHMNRSLLPYEQVSFYHINRSRFAICIGLFCQMNTSILSVNAVDIHSYYLLPKL